MSIINVYLILCIDYPNIVGILYNLLGHIHILIVETQRLLHYDVLYSTYSCFIHPLGQSTYYSDIMRPNLDHMV